MLIAVTAEDDTGLDSPVGRHFGLSPYFALVDVLGDAFQVDHQPGSVPNFIRELGADVVLSDGMGAHARQAFEEYGIQTALGAEGTAKQAIESFVESELSAERPCVGNHSHVHGSGCHE